MTSQLKEHTEKKGTDGYKFAWNSILIQQLFLNSLNFPLKIKSYGIIKCFILFIKKMSNYRTIDDSNRNVIDIDKLPFINIGFHILLSQYQLFFIICQFKISSAINKLRVVLEELTCMRKLIILLFH